MLSIFEKLFLFALDEEKGNILPFARKTLAYGLAGCVFAELTLLGKVRSNAKRRLELIDSASTGDEILDEVISEIQSSDKHHKLVFWISELSSRPKKLRDRIGERLVAKDQLYQEDRHFFWRSSSTEEPARMLPSKGEMKNPLRAMILSDGESDPHNLALLNVASACGLLNLIFTQDEFPIAQHCIHEKVIRAALENPAMQTIEEIEQAILGSLEDDLE